MSSAGLKLGVCVQFCAAQRAAHPSAMPCRHRSDDRRRPPRRARRVLQLDELYAVDVSDRRTDAGKASPAGAQHVVQHGAAQHRSSSNAILKMIPGIRSSSDAILKMRRGVRRSERKIKKKKLLEEIEAKFNKSKHNKKKSSYSLVFFKETHKMLDVGKSLGIELKGGRNYNLKRFVEMQEEELKEMIHALDDFEEEDILEDDIVSRRMPLSLWLFELKMGRV
ncbi:hypothetical protein RHMOL_Rhmol02G0143500 [Rhododendron molle]|uniref:Uncharacterized protein n=1 Tax=Rhododendron molle TaxID=49168 RepID=A0ACC0PQG1_RHOML|nr:hypothetical protein RHMOL_Rhmol02G0143500 [Rhododendron molle]